MPSHHPSDALLFSYVAGSLSECLSLPVATHLTLCRDCARFVAVMETTAGALLAAAEPMPLSPNALQKTLAALDRPPPPPLPVVNPELPAPLNRVPAGRWMPFPWGMWVRRFRTRGPGACVLVEGPPGAVLPRHRHQGEDLLVVLMGSYQDANGIWEVGDFAETPGGHDIAPPKVISACRAMFVVGTDRVEWLGLLGVIQRCARALRA